MTATLPPRPDTSFEVSPSAEEVDFFAESGYLVVERITTDEELDWLTTIYEYIFDTANTGLAGAPADRSRDRDSADVALLRQAFMPEFQYPELLETVFNRNARIYAAALLQVDVADLSSWGHMIRKSPGGPDAPWHQDEAYWEKEFEYLALGCWLPLHEVTEEMGAMQFIPGSHRGPVFDHQARDGDVEGHRLEADIPPGFPDPVACPLPKGGATFHHQRTLHYTAPNRTDRPRLAFPTEFQVAPRYRIEPADRPWVDDWRAFTGRLGATHYPADGRFVEVQS